MRKRVVWADLHGFPEVEGQEALAAEADAAYYYDLPDADTFVERCTGAQAVVWSWVDMRREVLDRLPALELACYLGVSANLIDMAQARSRGIIVCNTPGYGDSSVAEHALALMLALARHVARADASMRRGEWRSFEGTDLRGSVMGIVGLGGVGRELAAMGRCLGMEVICHTRRPSARRAARTGVRFVSLDELLATARFVHLNAALTEATRGMIGERELALMRQDAYLINTARAAVVDRKALHDALERRRIAGYATDVFLEEPTHAEPLAALDNVVLTPHVGFDTPGAKRRMLGIAMDNVLAYLRGEPANVLTA